MKTGAIPRRETAERDPGVLTKRNWGWGRLLKYNGKEDGKAPKGRFGPYVNTGTVQGGRSGAFAPVGDLSPQQRRWV